MRKKSLQIFLQQYHCVHSIFLKTILLAMTNLLIVDIKLMARPLCITHLVLLCELVDSQCQGWTSFFNKIPFLKNQKIKRFNLKSHNILYLTL
jgi:hypothetical protein